MIKFSTELFLTTHLGQAMPTYFNIPKETPKAVQLQSQHSGKKVWLPKAAVLFSEQYRCHYVADWFRKKLSVAQLSILQS